MIVLFYIKVVISIFYSGNFYLNNIYSKDKQITLATTEDGILNDYGITYTEDLTMIKNSTTSSYYTESDSEVEDLLLEFWHVDEHDNPLIWDSEKLQDTLNWITSEDFIPFKTEDDMNLTYYLKATRIIKKFNFEMKGYLEVTFKPFSKYAYMDYVKPLQINGEKIQYLYNYSNVDYEYSPIIELQNLGDEKTIISIQNKKSNKDPFIITGLKKNQRVIIDMLTGIVQDIETQENLFSKCNRKWLKMSDRGCDIQFKGNCLIVFKAQFPIKV